MQPSPTGRLWAAGLRVTRPRLAVLDALGAGSHMDADAVARLARLRIGTLSTGSWSTRPT